MFTRLSAEERKGLVERARAWAGALSQEQFLRRNDRLYAHPFGRERMHTFGWKEAGRIVASMDCLDLNVLAKSDTGEIREVKGGLIASVVTPESERGRGHATAMLQAFFSAEPRGSFVLYSDIGPAFYERFGFTPSPVVTVVEPIAALPAEGAGRSAVEERAEPISLESAVESIRYARFEMLRAVGGPGVTVYPDTLLADWQLERYRFYGEIAVKSFGEPWCWRVRGPRAAIAVVGPDPVSNKLDLLWHSGDAAVAVGFARRLAARWGLASLRYWQVRPVMDTEKVEWPMARLSDTSGQVRYLDVQLGDWW